MPGPEHNSPEASLNHDRLNGWKEISNYLGKSVRTVQRWERALAMPVHRIHTPRGEIVFGSKRELERWQSAKERERRAAPTVPEPVTLEWLQSLSEPELVRLVRGRRIPRAAWAEIICQACLRLHRNGAGAPETACHGVVEFLSRLPSSRYPVVTRQARSVLRRLRQSHSE